MPGLANWILLFQSTLSLRRATIDRFAIHDRTNDFNPRSPCGERLEFLFYFGEGDVFQSTLSLRRATGTAEDGKSGVHHFNPRSPCGERRGLIGKATELTLISIHALLAESDVALDSQTLLFVAFQSTLSLRRATEAPLTFS